MSNKMHGLLPLSTPAAQGVAAEGVEAFVDALGQAPEVSPHSFVLLRHGYVVASGWWSPYSAGTPQLLYSVSKSFTATAAGLAVGEGRLRLDDPVISYFPELGAEITDRRSRSMLVRHIATMGSGHTSDLWDDAVAADPANPVRGFLLLPPEREPGSVFAYNQCCTYTLATIVQRVTGRSLTEYLGQHLPGVLDGPEETGWREYPAGTQLGFSGLFARTSAIARLGQVYLDGGVWQGRQALGADWVKDAGTPHMSTAPRADIADDWGADSRRGYGYQFWASQHGYRAEGAYGQFCLVLPEQDAVVAITSESATGQAVLDAVWSELLPAFHETARLGTGADQRLGQRLEQLSVPTFPAAPVPPGERAAWSGTTFFPPGPATGGPGGTSVAGTHAGTAPARPVPTAVRVAADGDGWRIWLQDEGPEFPVRLGTNGWAVSTPDVDGARLPVACSGGWVGPAALRVDVLFLETPHRMSITCELPGRTFGAQWVTAPLHARHFRHLARSAVLDLQA